LRGGQVELLADRFFTQQPHAQGGLHKAIEREEVGEEGLHAGTGGGELGAGGGIVAGIFKKALIVAKGFLQHFLPQFAELGFVHFLSGQAREKIKRGPGLARGSLGAAALGIGFDGFAALQLVGGLGVRLLARDQQGGNGEANSGQQKNDEG
jgi:hypothetical protein